MSPQSNYAAALSGDDLSLKEKPMDPVSLKENASDDDHSEPGGMGFEIEASQLPKGYFKSSRFIGSMCASGASFAAGVGGFALAAPILGIINADIGPSPYLIWIALAYTLPVAVGLLLVGRLSDIFGRRWFFITGGILGLIGCIICAVAQNIGTVIGGTVLIGLAASAQISVTYVVSELVPVKHRFIASSFVYMWVMPFTGMGPAISYAFVVHSSWRGCYYLMIAVNAFAVACWILFYFPPSFEMKHQNTTKMQVLKQFDYVGLFLFAAGFLLLLMGLSWGGGLYAWKSVHVITTIALGFILVIAFICWEAFATLPEPLIPPHLFRNGSWVAVVFTVAITVTVYYAFSIVWPQMVFGLYTTDYITGGLLASVLGAGTNIGQLASGLLARRLGNQKWQFVGAVSAGGAFLGAVACATPDNKATAAALLTIGCFFLGYIDSIGLAMAGICIKDQKDIGSAVGVAGSIRSAVSAIGTAVYSVILTNRLGQTIPSVVPPALIQAGLPASSVTDFLTAYTVGTPAAFAKIPGLTPNILAVGTRAYKIAAAQAYQTVFYSTIAFSGVAVIISFFTPNAKSFLTSEVAATLRSRQGGAKESTKVEATV